MVEDLLIVRRQVEAIRHSEMPTSMIIEEWKSIDEIARSTIRMHLAKNDYFIMVMRNDNVQTVGEAPSCLRKLVLLIETHIDSKVFQYEDERHGSGDLPHQHFQSGVI